MIASLAVAQPAVAQPAVARDASSVRAPEDDGRGTDGVRWTPKRTITFGVPDLVVAGAAGATVLTAVIVQPRAKHWQGGILADEDIRDALRVPSLYGRYATRDASDVGVSLMTTWPFLVDALITTWWYRGRADLARNMALVSAEAFGIAAAVQSVANDIGSRERPFGRLCGKGIPEDSVDCDPNVRYRSFFSGHTTLSFVSAGLLCTNHLGLGLLGREGDRATCVGGVAVAAMTGIFRITSDMHYASDVAIGALVGTAIGVTVPLLHLSAPGPEKSALRRSRLLSDVRISPVGQGIGLVGAF